MGCVGQNLNSRKVRSISYVPVSRSRLGGGSFKRAIVARAGPTMREYRRHVLGKRINFLPIPNGS